jgi:AcrR family transcriptional regulator
MDAYWPKPHINYLEYEKAGLITRTFRRLDPERQQAVLQAILEDAAEAGPSAMNIKRIAERAGVAIGSLYTYFGSRQRLIDFAVRLVTTSTIDLFNLTGPYLLSVPLEEALKMWVQGGLEWAQAQSGMLQFFGRAAYQGDPALQASVVEPIATSMREVLAERFRKAMEDGEVREGVDVEAAARAANILLTALSDSQLLPYLNTYFQATDEEMPFERVLEAAIGLILHGIGKEP